MGSSNDNLSNEEKFIIDFRIRHQWNKRTKTQLLSSFLLQQSSQTDARSDEADPFKGSCPHRPMHSDPLSLDHSSPKVFTSKCPLIFLHLFLLLLSRVSNYIAFTVNLFCIPHNLHGSELSLNRNLILKHSIVPIAFQSFPQAWKSALILNTLTFGNIINLPQQYSDIDPP